MAQPGGPDGHGAQSRRGRSVQMNPAPEAPLPAAARRATDPSGVAAAMRRLLATVRGSAEARSVVTVVDGSPLHHLEAGSGEPVVLVHGGSGGGGNWFRLIGPLAQAHRVLAPDLPGFGLSPSRRARAPLGVHGAELLAEWLDAQGVAGATVVGTSFGGLAALRLAQRAPDHVARLLLVSAAGLGRSAGWPLRAAAMPILGTAVLKPSRAGTALLFRTLLTTRRESMSREQQERLIDYLFCAAAATDIRALAQSVRLFGGLRGQREWLMPAELAALRQPVGIVWGGRDRLIPASHGRAAAEVLRGSFFELLPRIGHSPNWEAPDAVLAAFERLVAPSGPKGA
jgi:pimeloyl-ACP methyl ester carboxylesterase